MVCYDHIERISNSLLFDKDGLQCYVVHSNGRNFSIYPDRGFDITPLELAGMIYSHEEYANGPIRLLACYAGIYEDGAAQEVANYLRVPVIAAVQSVYIDFEQSEFLVLPAGFTAEDVNNLKQEKNYIISEQYQSEQWLTFYPQ